ncbi:mucin-4-like [Protopterus annectens]|uniref:mucin-4-like n=1 Tax=Protopterus annectens TaxID=7888 RepID=UPI001CFB5A05|nr:mucin-4-like [Protopterus annectens]
MKGELDSKHGTLCYQQDSLNKTICINVNECNQSPGPCDANLGSCRDTNGSFICDCKSGYRIKADGRTCENINECTEGKYYCPLNSTCFDTDGNYSCLCDTGFTGNSCEDIDECTVASICQGNRYCLNTIGSYKCLCSPGFQDIAGVCTPTPTDLGSTTGMMESMVNGTWTTPAEKVTLSINTNATTTKVDTLQSTTLTYTFSTIKTVQTLNGTTNLVTLTDLNKSASEPISSQEPPVTLTVPTFSATVPSVDKSLSPIMSTQHTLLSSVTESNTDYANILKTSLSADLMNSTSITNNQFLTLSTTQDISTSLGNSVSQKSDSITTPVDSLSTSPVLDFNFSTSAENVSSFSTVQKTSLNSGISALHTTSDNTVSASTVSAKDTTDLVTSVSVPAVTTSLTTTATHDVSDSPSLTSSKAVENITLPAGSASTVTAVGLHDSTPAGHGTPFMTKEVTSISSGGTVLQNVTAENTNPASTISANVTTQLVTSMSTVTLTNTLSTNTARVVSTSTGLTSQKVTESITAAAGSPSTVTAVGLHDSTPAGNVSPSMTMQVTSISPGGTTLQNATTNNVNPTDVTTALVTSMSITSLPTSLTKSAGPEGSASQGLTSQKATESITAPAGSPSTITAVGLSDSTPAGNGTPFVTKEVTSISSRSSALQSAVTYNTNPTNSFSANVTTHLATSMSSVTLTNAEQGISTSSELVSQKATENITVPTGSPSTIAAVGLNVTTSTGNGTPFMTKEVTSISSGGTALQNATAENTNPVNTISANVTTHLVTSMYTVTLTNTLSTNTAQIVSTSTGLTSQKVTEIVPTGSFNTVSIVSLNFSTSEANMIPFSSTQPTSVSSGSSTLQSAVTYNTNPTNSFSANVTTHSSTSMSTVTLTNATQGISTSSELVSQKVTGNITVPTGSPSTIAAVSLNVTTSTGNVTAFMTKEATSISSGSTLQNVITYNTNPANNYSANTTHFATSMSTVTLTNATQEISTSSGLVSQKVTENITVPTGSPSTIAAVSLNVTTSTGNGTAFMTKEIASISSGSTTSQSVITYNTNPANNYSTDTTHLVTSMSKVTLTNATQGISTSSGLVSQKVTENIIVPTGSPSTIAAVSLNITTSTGNGTAFMTKEIASISSGSTTSQSVITYNTNPANNYSTDTTHLATSMSTVTLTNATQGISTSSGLVSQKVTENITVPTGSPSTIAAVSLNVTTSTGNGTAFMTKEIASISSGSTTSQSIITYNTNPANNYSTDTTHLTTSMSTVTLTNATQGISTSSGLVSQKVTENITVPTGSPSTIATVSLNVTTSTGNGTAFMTKEIASISSGSTTSQSIITYNTNPANNYSTDTTHLVTSMSKVTLTNATQGISTSSGLVSQKVTGNITVPTGSPSTIAAVSLNVTTSTGNGTPFMTKEVTYFSSGSTTLQNATAKNTNPASSVSPNVTTHLVTSMSTVTLTNAEQGASTSSELVSQKATENIIVPTASLSTVNVNFSASVTNMTVLTTQPSSVSSGSSTLQTNSTDNIKSASSVSTDVTTNFLSKTGSTTSLPISMGPTFSTTTSSGVTFSTSGVNAIASSTTQSNSISTGKSAFQSVTTSNMVTSSTSDATSKTTSLSSVATQGSTVTSGSLISQNGSGISTFTTPIPASLVNNASSGVTASSTASTIADNTTITFNRATTTAVLPTSTTRMSTTTASAVLPTSTTRMSTTTVSTTVTTMATLLPAVQLFTYGEKVGDKVFSSKSVDAVSGLFKPEIGFPFGETLYNSLYFTDNGQIIFPSSDNDVFNYTNPPVQGFSKGFKTPMIAAFWDDADLSTGPGKIYYKEYDTLTSSNDSFVQNVSSMIQSYKKVASYLPKWSLKITWENVSPFPAANSLTQINTYQAVLTTDGSVSYVLLLFKDGEMKWNVTTRINNNALVGFFSGDNYFENDEITKLQPAQKYHPDEYITTNSVVRGLRIYQLTQTAQVNYRLQCMLWYVSEPNPADWVKDSSCCPRTYQQGLLDGRYLNYYSDIYNPYTLRTTSSKSYTSGIRCVYNKNQQFVEGWNERIQNVAFEMNPYNSCCKNVNKQAFCDKYAEKRPKVTCTNYISPSIKTAYGEPHFTTMDGKSFTFNGLGDFILVNTTDENSLFILEGRTNQTSGDPYTSFIDVAAQYTSKTTNKVQFTLGSNNAIQILLNGGNVSFSYSPELQTDFYNGTDLYIKRNDSINVTFSGKVSLSLSASFGMINILLYLPNDYNNKTKGLFGKKKRVQFTLGSNNAIQILLNGGNASFSYSPELQTDFYNGTDLYIKRNDSINVTFSGKVSLSLSASFGMINILLYLPNDYNNKTKGLFGVWNGNQDDDFTMPNGTTIPVNSSESDIYNYGLTWRSGSNTLFTTKNTYENSNFTPTFTDQLATLNSSWYNIVQNQCGDSPPCIFDAFMTKNINVGLQTRTMEFVFRQANLTLNSYPPTIMGDDIIQANISETVKKKYNASGKQVYFMTFTSSDLNITDNGTLIWMPTSANPFTADIVAIDASNNLSSIISPMFVISLCGSNGISLWNDTTRLNDSSLYQATCQCINGYVGSNCQSQPDPCSSTSCYANVSCSTGTGCGPCPTGLTGDGIHCSDVNECNSANPCDGNATCMNSIGSFSCICNPGFTGKLSLFNIQLINKAL